MASDGRRGLVPHDVRARLEALRALYVPETIDEARRRLTRERPLDRSSFDERVARRLAELRAVCELARVLQRRR